MSSFSTYIVGFIILVVGLALAAYLLNIPGMWIAVGVIVLIGIGVLMATSRTKPRDPPVAYRPEGPGQGSGAKGQGEPNPWPSLFWPLALGPWPTLPTRPSRRRD